MRLLATATIAILLSASAAAKTILVATWNIEHLRAESGIGSFPRTDRDYQALADIVAELNADIIALQEVDGPEAAARVFDPSEYDFFFSDRNHVMRTGFAVRHSIPVIAHDDSVELSLGGSPRRGSDADSDG